MEPSKNQRPVVERPESNIMYICKAIKNVPAEEGTFLVGAEDKKVLKIRVGDSISVDDIF